METIVKIIADGLIVPIVLLGVFALIRYVPGRDRYQTYARVMMAGLTSYAAAKLIGLFFQPSTTRPFELLGVEAGASFLNNPGFPSDHALFAMAIVLAIWFGARHKKIAIIAFVLTIFVAVGRVIALVHTPLDVIGGIVIAFIGVIWYVYPAKSPTKLIK